MKEDGTFPVNNPNWFLQQEALATLFPGGYEQFAELFSGSMGGGGGGGVGNKGQAQIEGTAEKAKEEEKPEEV